MGHPPMKLLQSTPFALGHLWEGLLSVEHHHVRLISTRRMHGHRQSFPVGRNFDLLRVNDLSVDFVSHLQSVLVHPPDGGERAGPLMGIVLTIELHVCRLVP